ncbi:hypothetical protein V6N11_079272 [Hibiscus sabdariffa]|uniref:NB-ARC domain-containing protein n=1 Tax=Hibiscus sabdariffa TaxID=183260 RepID=A0ABR2RVF5_9ROSI
MDFVLNKIDKHLDNHMCFDQYWRDLKRKLKALNGLKEDIDSTLSIELRPRKKLKAEVQIWLENVDRINCDVQDLDGRIQESNALARGFHAEDVLKNIEEVSQLIIQRGKFHGGLVVDNPQWIGQVLSTTNLSGEAVKACVEEIWQCLMDDEIPKIGLWGMGGVGKTSIMKVINNQLLKQTGKFDIVIWITASKEMSIAKLQKDIASKIGVEFCGDEDETTRAGMLFERFLRKSRFVMILDDLWEKVSLERIGIPEPFVGSKLVLTTRSSDVCRQVGCRVIKVKPLMEEEAWKLFLEKVGRDILNIPGVEPIARSMARRCAGLPLGVITIASCMKSIDDICDWRNALTELTLGKKVCALYPEDEEIEEEELVQLWIAEGLVEEMDRMQAGFDRGRAIMNRLISNCLLEVFIQRENRRRVKMHDLLRDMALKIVESRFLVKAGMMLEKAPDVQEWGKDLEKVSLMRNRRLYIPLELSPPMCPRLTTLLLSHCGIASIPEGFFEHMDALKVLDLTRNPIKNLPNSLSKCLRLTTLLLSGCRIKSIPEGFFKHTDALKFLDLSRNPIQSLPFSLSNLKNLTSLFLADCEDLENVPSLSHLQVLRKLDLQGTNIKEIPHGMENLVSLEYLNLYYFNTINEIPKGILSRLSSLQNLIVGETLISGKEVGGLKKLEILRGRFHDWHNLHMYLQAFHGRREEPLQYIIFVGDVLRDAVGNDARKVIVVRGCNIHTYQIMLPRDIEALHIWDCNLEFREEYPLFSRFILFSPASFSSLEYLHLYYCGNMKKLFSPNCVPLKLRELRVFGCKQVEEVIASEGGMVTMEIRLPRLWKLRLCDLPELKRICSVGGVLVCGSLNEIEIRNCLKLKRMALKLLQLDNVQLRPSGCLSLRIYIKPKEWWETVEWDGPDAKSLLEPFVMNCPRLERMGLSLPQRDNVPPSASAPPCRSIGIRPKEWWESVEWDAKPLSEPFVRAIPC